MFKKPIGTSTPARRLISAWMRRTRFSPPLRMPMSSRFWDAPFGSMICCAKRSIVRCSCAEESTTRFSCSVSSRVVLNLVSSPFAWQWCRAGLGYSRRAASRPPPGRCTARASVAREGATQRAPPSLSARGYKDTTRRRRVRVFYTAAAITAVLLVLAASGHPAAAATDAQYSACRSRVLQAFPGLPASAISLNQAWETNGSVRLDWTAARAGAGLCVIGPHNEVFQFVNDQAAWPPGNGNRPLPPGGNQSFGNIPGVGQFVVVNGSGTSENNGSVNFQAFVNGR